MYPIPPSEVVTAPVVAAVAPQKMPAVLMEAPWWLTTAELATSALTAWLASTAYGTAPRCVNGSVGVEPFMFTWSWTQRSVLALIAATQLGSIGTWKRPVLSNVVEIAPACAVHAGVPDPTEFE